VLSAVPAAVLIVTVLVAGLEPGETEAGLNEQVAPEGRPEQAKLTDPANPFAAATEMVTEVEPPELTVVLPGEALRLKYGMVRPYTSNCPEKVGRYTLPFAIVGGLNFAKFPALSFEFIWLFQSSFATFEASSACKIPGAPGMSPLARAFGAQRIPVPAWFPFAETETGEVSTSPLGLEIFPTATGVVWNVEPLNFHAFITSPDTHK
jgi:hypothetical protein